MIIGTAGHVDHGKTTLVRALTGVAGDRLAEERRRGMTIDLGYAYAGKWGFIDVPGHERLVATMLAGAGGIDAALLVVAADDGVMPQTVEHARILDLLGIDRGVIAITRADRAPDRVAAVAAGMRALLAGSGLAGAEMQPVSAVTGEGVAALRAALERLGPRPREVALHPRLAVDRAFTMVGAGLVVTGTLVSGRIAVGDRLLVSPAGRPVRVRGLHAHNRPAEGAEAGQRVALNLAGISKPEVARGDWVLHPDAHAPTALLDGRLRLLPGSPAPRDGLPVHLHLAASHATGRLLSLAEGVGRVVLDRPIGALVGDRFVLRDAGGSRTIGGGVVIDPFPTRRGGRSAARLHLLQMGVQPAPVALAQRIATGPVALADFIRARNLPADAQPALLAEAGAVAFGGFAVAPGVPAALRRAITETLGAHHAARPDEPGLAAARLLAALPGRPPPPLFAAGLAAVLRRGEAQQDGPFLRLPSHRIVLAPAEERLWDAVRPRLAANRFRPPRTRDLAADLRVPEAALRATLKRLGRLGRLVEVAPDLFFLRETVAEIIGIVAGIEAVEGTVVAASLRDRLDNGRKVAIHILEFLDTAGVTRRAGDARRLRRERMALFGPSGAPATRNKIPANGLTGPPDGCQHSARAQKRGSDETG